LRLKFIGDVSVEREAEVSNKSIVNSFSTSLLCGALLVVLCFPTPLLADPPDWAAKLQQQLQSEKACKVLYLVNVKEYRLLGHDIVEARVQCDDGRSFDVTRQGRQSPFAINPCKPIVC
jgi:hypothetical protein